MQLILGSVAKWPPFGKELLTLLVVQSLFIMFICYIIGSFQFSFDDSFLVPIKTVPGGSFFLCLEHTLFVATTGNSFLISYLNFLISYLNFLISYLNFPMLIDGVSSSIKFEVTSISNGHFSTSVFSTLYLRSILMLPVPFPVTSTLNSVPFSAGSWKNIYSGRITNKIKQSHKYGYILQGNRF